MEGPRLLFGGLGHIQNRTTRPQTPRPARAWTLAALTESRTKLPAMSGPLVTDATHPTAKRPRDRLRRAAGASERRRARPLLSLAARAELTIGMATWGSSRSGMPPPTGTIGFALRECATCRAHNTIETGAPVEAQHGVRWQSSAMRTHPGLARTEPDAQPTGDLPLLSRGAAAS